MRHSTRTTRLFARLWRMLRLANEARHAASGPIAWATHKLRKEAVSRLAGPLRRFSWWGRWFWGRKPL